MRHRSFAIMAGCFDGVKVKAERLSYEGPFGVGYGVCTFIPEQSENKESDNESPRRGRKPACQARISGY